MNHGLHAEYWAVISQYILVAPYAKKIVWGHCVCYFAIRSVWIIRTMNVCSAILINCTYLYTASRTILVVSTVLLSMLYFVGCYIWTTVPLAVQAKVRYENARTILCYTIDGIDNTWRVIYQTLTPLAPQCQTDRSQTMPSIRGGLIVSGLRVVLNDVVLCLIFPIFLFSNNWKVR